MKTVYFCAGLEKRSHQPRLKEGFCFLCLCKMVQLHYMPWHALDVARGDGRTQAPATRGPGAAGQRPELPTSEQPGLQCVQPWHTPCPPGAQPSQQRVAGNSQVSQGLAGRAEGPVGAPGRTSPGSLEVRRLG